MKRSRKTRSAGLHRRDPHVRRSARCYERLIAGFESVLRVIAEAEPSLSRERRSERPGIATERGRESLRQCLNAMLRDGQPVRNRRDCHALTDHFDLMPGRVIAHLDGFGFMVRDSGEEDVFLYARQMDAVFHGTGP